MTTFQHARTRTVLAALVAAATLTACQRADDRPATGDSAAMPGMGGMEGMGGMAGMGGMMGTAAMDSMHAHMGAMEKMSGHRMKEMLPMHRQMAANMLSRMNSEMRSMNMPADARWNATVDSLRQDLVRMPEMGTQELEAMMPAHHGRMMRLMQMHGDMMKGMTP